MPASHMTDEVLDKVKQLLRLHPGRTPVVICIEYPTGEKVFLDTHNSYKVTPDEKLIEDIERVLGEESVYVAVNPAPCRKAREGRRRWTRETEAPDES
jgi:hypothetical protein